LAAPAAKQNDKPKQVGKQATAVDEKPIADKQPGNNKADNKKAENKKDEKKAARKDVLAVQTPQPKSPQEELRLVNVPALRRAIADLQATFGKRYGQASKFLERAKRCEQQQEKLEAALAKREPATADKVSALLREFRQLQQDALLANPLLDFDQLLLVQRSLTSPKLGLPQNWQGNCALPKAGYDNQIAVLSPVRPSGQLTTLYQPPEKQFVGDVDLHFDADRLLFSMPGSHQRWQIWELRTDGTGLRQVTPGEEPDVDNYDPCYLPAGRIIFCSTRCFHGVPCVSGNNTVANLCMMNADGSGQRQLCFDQDHNWCPTVLNDGRVLYTRWEYSDSPHYFTRLLFHMNPDGTGQMEYYGSNSPWPNSTYFARPIPGHPTKVVAVISGHHGVPRMGELVVFDPALGRRDAHGAVQRIPGYGVPVQPVIGDQIVANSWPKFLHPYPLSEKYFLTAMKPDAASPWGLYLVDVFDNLVLIKETPGYALLEPLPLRKTKRPPVIADRVDLASREATIYLSDIYAGRGLDGVPRGTVKRLRIYEPHYAYPKMGGHIHIGIDGPWDVHRILGTVPVEGDGSASFRVPANTPVAVQPLDAQGRAVQLMRSWYTAMPGEIGSCVGCHENQNAAPPAQPTLAMKRKPSTITPWLGPARGFSFVREVQPVLDQYCVGCHDGHRTSDGQVVFDLRADGSQVELAVGKAKHHYTPSYVALHPYVHRPGPESDYALQVPMEYHASTSELVQLLEKGHYNVKLDAEAWERLVTWIDLNVPDHGTWSEFREIAQDFHDRRLAMRTQYANRPEDPEVYPTAAPDRPAFVQPEPLPKKGKRLTLPGWPLTAAKATQRQRAAAEAAGVGQPELTLDLGDGVTLDLVLVPAGEFLLGSVDGAADESSQSRMKIARPFWLGKFEVTNAQFALFQPQHDSAYISFLNKDHSSRGEPVNHPSQPVLRVSWQQALDFGHWLSEKTGRKFTLPTEAQWEYACRAGTDSPLNYGDCTSDFGQLANLADQRLLSLCRRDSPKWIPCVAAVNDGAVVTNSVGKYPPNAWGLCDMHGNVAEWTRTAYRCYPYDPADGRDDPVADGPKSVRGGSFYDRPQRARSAFRQHYPAWQRASTVGFRVAMELE
jgi:formylglycine-generating enzyme required for sulfatase activity